MAFKRVWALIVGSNKKDEKVRSLGFCLSKWVKNNDNNKISSSINSLEVVNYLIITSPQTGRFAPQLVHSTDSRS